MSFPATAEGCSCLSSNHTKRKLKRHHERFCFSRAGKSPTLTSVLAFPLLSWASRGLQTPALCKQHRRSVLAVANFAVWPWGEEHRAAGESVEPARHPTAPRGDRLWCRARPGKCTILHTAQHPAGTLGRTWSVLPWYKDNVISLKSTRNCRMAWFAQRRRIPHCTGWWLSKEETQPCPSSPG